jgi:hypothetical protein
MAADEEKDGGMDNLTWQNQAQEAHSGLKNMRATPQSR